MSIFNLPCPHNDGKECRYCHSVKAQDGWRFKGCFCPPLNGKFIAEVKECPDKAQKGEQYINKAAVVAEIEKRLSLLENGTGDSEVMKRVEGVIKGYKSILSFLDTLETKEVDLNKEFYDFLDTLIGKDNGHLSEDELFRIAEYFFELGLAQKGE